MVAGYGALGWSESQSVGTGDTLTRELKRQVFSRLFESFFGVGDNIT